ncbi:MAG: LysM peptidoglycan-binding domain-containing protein [bacterium]
MNTQKQILLMISLLFIFVGGCAVYTAVDLPVRARDQQAWGQDQSLERGALLFANNCRTCHGSTGQGGVGPQLRANEATKFQDQDPLVLKANRALIQRTLYCGRAGTLMPAWLNTNGGSLNAVQLSHIIDFLTYPVADDGTGEMTSKWWATAEEFAHNLNDEVAVLVGGDTLATIAKAHGIGPKELAAANNLPVDGILKQGTELKIPGFKNDPNGFIYTAYKDNETITKIAEAQFVGAIILADLNNINYDFTEKRGVATFALATAEGAEIPGLFPGDKLKLPQGATYQVASGDSKLTITQRHGITVSALEALNKDITSLASDAPLAFEKTLTLPKPTVIVQEGQALGTIAQQHGVKAEDLATENGSTVDATLAAGTALKLPSGTKYTVQTGDTWEEVAAAHATTAAELASANGAKETETLSSAVILQLPQIDAYTVQGQTLAQVAAGYGNVTADSLATKNAIKATDTLRVGTGLKLPADAWGSAPPDAKNPGTACVQYAISRSAFDTVVPNGTPAAAATQPATASKDVKIEAHAADWTVTADGTAQAPNKGIALVAKGTAVAFSSVAGLHTITVNGKKDGDNLKQGDSRQFTFNDAGTFKITCDFHPEMLATIFVQ